MVTLVEEYPVGTTFLKFFRGYGVWEGRVISFDGDSYVVGYDDGDTEAIDADAMDKVMARSDRLREKNVSVATSQTSRLTTAAKTDDDGSAPATRSFRKGQHVWVALGDQQHPAVVHCLSGDGLEEGMVTIQWSMASKLEDVPLDCLLPMFEEGEDKDGKLVVSSHSKRERKRTLTYAEEMDMLSFAPKKRLKKEEPLAHDDKMDAVASKEIAKKEDPPTREYGQKMPAAGNVETKSTVRNQMKGGYYHEGFRFHYLKPARKTDHIYRCSHYSSASCPVKLRVNSKTDAAQAYTSKGEPVEHTDECKRKNGKKVETRNLTPGARMQDHLGQGSKSSVKREIALRGWETRRKNFALWHGEKGASGQLENEERDDDSHLNESEQVHFEEGQHVFAHIGKAYHPAVIESIQDGSNVGIVAKVRWTTTNTYGEVKVENLLPMFGQDHGGCRRKRKETDRFVPPTEPWNVKGKGTRTTRIPPPKGKRVKKAQAAWKKATKEETSDYVRDNLEAFAKVPAGLAPGPDWESRVIVLGRDCYRRTQWISPEKEIVFETAKAAFEYESIRRRCNGDEVQALTLYVMAKKAAGQRYQIANRGRLGGMPLKAGKQRQGESPRHRSASIKDDSSIKDGEEDMTLAQIEELNSLWDYYLKPSTRENEEIPSGMILRKREASCNLLRYKNSVFRQKAHSAILRLHRLGRKAEIYRILKAIHDHDLSMDSGDGPSQILNEILGPATGHDEVEILDDAAVAALQEGKKGRTVGDAASNGGAEVLKSTVDEMCQQAESRQQCLNGQLNADDVDGVGGGAKVHVKQEFAGETAELERTTDNSVNCAGESVDQAVCTPTSSHEEAELLPTEDNNCDVAAVTPGSSEEGRSSLEIDKDAIESCDDDSLDLAEVNCQPNSQAVQNVLEEWVGQDGPATDDGGDCCEKVQGNISNKTTEDCNKSDTQQEVVDLCQDQQPELVDLTWLPSVKPSLKPGEVIVLD